MAANVDEGAPASLFARWVSRPRSPWLTVGIGVALVLAPAVATTLDGVLAEYVREGFWRLLLLPAVVVLYILIVAPILDRAERRVVEAFRPVVLVDDEEYERLVAEASRLSPIGEGLALGLGVVFGLWLGRSWVAGDSLFWTKLYLPLSAALMFGLLGWTIYAAVAGTRLIAELHRQPLRFDLFDPRPFQPIGRQSLANALVFVGGVVLATLLGLSWESFFAWQNWIVLFLLMLVPVVVFFLSMRDTHRVLATEKRRELEAMQQRIVGASRTLVARFDAGEDGSRLAAEINALVIYEERLKEVQTWPYDTATLRTLFFSVILPAGAAIVQGVFRIWYE